jgi:hypothetical protein
MESFATRRISNSPSTPANSWNGVDSCQSAFGFPIDPYRRPEWGEKWTLRTIAPHVTLRRKLRVMRDKLPKGSAFPLKASILEAALVNAGIVTDVSLSLRHDSFWSTRPLIVANFMPVGAVLNDEEVFWVTCRSVAASECSEARAYVDPIVILAFAEWAAEMETLPFRSTRRKSHEKFWDWHLS